MLVFEERGKPEYPEKNLSEQRMEPTTNTTHIWRRVRESLPSHIGGRRVLSPLRHHCAIAAPYDVHKDDNDNDNDVDNDNSADIDDDDDNDDDKGNNDEKTMIMTMIVTKLTLMVAMVTTMMTSQSNDDNNMTE